MEAERKNVYNQAGQVIGQLVMDGRGLLWLEKTGLNPDVHQLHTPRAWATDVEHLDILEKMEGQGIRLLDTRGSIWEASTFLFRSRGLIVKRKHGDQVALPLKWWTQRPVMGFQLELFSVAVH